MDAMKFKPFEDREMGPTGSVQGSVLELNESVNPDLSRWKPLKPALKFGQVLFLYAPSGIESSSLQIKINHPGVIAVIE